MDAELPPDPFADEELRYLLWRVREIDEVTGDVTVKLSAVGWGWLHTLEGIESDGTYGKLTVSTSEDDEVIENDAEPTE